MMDDISEIVGKIPAAIEVTEDEIKIAFKDGSIGTFYHEQECCEYVRIEEVAGDWNDLIGHPLLVADERVRDNHSDANPDGFVGEDSDTWTFYTFRSIGGTIDVRWHGTSNGYYSEKVTFALTPAPGAVPA